MYKEPKKTGKPNALDDDPVDRGTTGQSLRDKKMRYDPATGKPTDSNKVDYDGADIDYDMDDDYE